MSHHIRATGALPGHGDIGPPARCEPDSSIGFLDTAFRLRFVDGFALFVSAAFAACLRFTSTISAYDMIFASPWLITVLFALFRTLFSSFCLSKLSFHSAKVNGRQMLFLSHAGASEDKDRWLYCLRRTFARACDKGYIHPLTWWALLESGSSAVLAPAGDREEAAARRVLQSVLTSLLERGSD